MAGRRRDPRDLTGGVQAPTWAGLVGGSGAGQVLMGSGTLIAVPSLTLNFPGTLFQWTAGTINGAVTNLNQFNISGAGDSVLGRSTFLNNLGLVRHSGTGRLNIQLNARFENLAAGIYDLGTDTGIFSSDFGPWFFDNWGLLRKSGGTGNSTISVVFNNQGGAIDVESGALTLANNGINSNALVNVAAGTVLDLTGGQGPTWAGLLKATGAGQVQFSAGNLSALPSLSLDCSNGLFQWTGGALGGNLSNLNVMTLSGSNDMTLARNSFVNNVGLVRHTGTGGLNVQLNGRFENRATGTYDLTTDTSIFSKDFGPWFFDNWGLLRKSGGTNTATISVNFNNLGGVIDVESGALTLANSGSNSNGVFTVAGGAVLDLTGGQAPTWAGQISGSLSRTDGFWQRHVARLPEPDHEFPGQFLSVERRQLDGRGHQPGSGHD